MTNPTPSAEPEDNVIETMCRAHDAEDAAQRGEPSPWDFTYGDGDPYGDDPDGVVEFSTFKADRIAAMRAALSASGLLERERVLLERIDKDLGVRQHDAQIDARECAPGSYGKGLCNGEVRGLSVARHAIRTALSNPLKAD